MPATVRANIVSAVPLVVFILFSAFTALAAPPLPAGNTLLPGYQVLPDLNAATAWQAPADSVTLSPNPRLSALGLTVSGLKQDEKRLITLRQPVRLDDGVKAVNFWTCFPAAPEDYGLAMTPLFADRDGKEIAGPKVSFLSGHIGAPNGRKSGLWFYMSWERDAKAVAMTGLSVEVYYVGPHTDLSKPRTILLKDVGLERLDYAKAPLYYVVGNYRDNFNCTGFNGAMARALTDLTGASNTPFMLLDNILDQAKLGRPNRLNVDVSVYDIQDRQVYATRLKRLSAAGPADFFVKIPIPITAPGTYSIRGKSYDADTGAYFTTDWTKLVVLKGQAQALQPIAKPGLMEINPDKPFGRLEKADPRRIDLHIGAINFDAGPVELRWTTIPYDAWLPGFSAVRDCKFDHVLPVTGPGVISQPYEPRRSVELVVAELWQGGRRIDHEERPIGIRNDLDKAPDFTRRAEIPSLDDQAGPGRNWMNVQFHNNPGNDIYASIARNIDQAKKLTPNLGFGLDLSMAEPIPGVYNWDYLTPMFDLAAQKGCRLTPYMAMKWPTNWAPLEFQVDEGGCAHRVGTMWGTMVGKYLYPTGDVAPGIITDFLRQFARHYLNHPGLGAYYLENEHLDTQWMEWPVSRSYHEGYRRKFAAYLARRYESVDRLNAAYGTRYASFDEVQLPVPARQPRKIALVDFRLFQREAVEGFVRSQFDAIRQEDPQRPILVYVFGEETDNFLRHVAGSGGMLANGGVHSDFNSDHEYERANAIPGLRFRMEPHDMYNYDPIPNGFDEMIFGMLAMGGRGLGFHIFLPGFEDFSYDKAMQPGQKTGLDKLVKYAPMLRELRDAEKLHDPIGIMALRGAPILGEKFEWTIWQIHCALYALRHTSPYVAFPETRLSYLDNSKVIFLGGSVIDAAQTTYLKDFVARGGKIVMEDAAARRSLEDPDSKVPHALFASLGIDPAVKGAQLPGITQPHDIYPAGPGQVLVIRGHDLWNDKWDAMIPAILDWAGVRQRLVDSDDRYMQMHVLQNANTFYLATTHRGHQQSGYDGPKTWTGQVRFLKPLPEGRYRLTEMMSGADLGTFAPAQLAAGFDAGPYTELQMKIFRLTPDIRKPAN